MPTPWRDDEPITGINVTPLVDVTLVLVLVFMIAAPFLGETGLRIRGSDARAVPSGSFREPVLVELSAGEVRVQGRAVPMSGLAVRLRSLLGSRGGAKVAVSADPRVSHGLLVRALDEAASAGARELDVLEPLEGR